MKKILFIFLTLVFLSGLVGSASAFVAASSNYRLEKDSLNIGGTDFSSSANFLNSDTLAELASGLGFGSNNNASTGYRYMELDPTPIPVVYGCMDIKANNYNSLATADDGSCTYDYTCVGCGRAGCKDPLATNYDESANIRDDTLCTYETKVPNIKNFQAVYRLAPGDVRLSWVNPTVPFKRILIRRLVGPTPPLSPSEGTFIYSGKGEEAFDSDVVPGTLYTYTAFVQDLSEGYPSAASASVLIPRSGEPPINPPEIFSSLSASSSTLSSVAGIKWNISFSQPAERTKTFDWRGTVRLIGVKPVTVLLKFNAVIPSLKTIGLTLTDPYDNNRVYSFLMRRTAQVSTYEATLSPLLRPGSYPIDVYVINYDNQTIEHIKGRLVIPNTALPSAAVVGLIFGSLPLLYDLWNLLIRLFSYLLGRRRHDKPWGTVYDSVTKQPLDPVYVTAETMGPDGKLKEVASAITDIDGRFSFFLPDGTYYLRAGKTHYKFPSTKLQGREMDELYRNLYFGAPVLVTGQNVVNLNIPMDSVDFDWNEFAKTKTNFFRFYDRRELWLNRIYGFFFGLGFLLSLYVSFVDPSFFNIIITLLYASVFLYNKFWRDRYKPLRVIKESTGEPLSFAIVRVFIPNLNQQIKQVVADKFGRFYLLVRPGVYYYTVEEKQLDGSYLKTYQSEPINFSDGILTRDISVK